MKTLITPLLCAVALFGCERSKTDTRQADRYTYDEPSPTVRDTDRPTTTAPRDDIDTPGTPDELSRTDTAPSTPSPNAPSAGTTGTDRPGMAATGTGAVGSVGTGTTGMDTPGSGLAGSGTTGTTGPGVAGSGTTGTSTTGTGTADTTVATGTGAAAGTTGADTKGTTGADTKEETDRAKKSDSDREKAHQQLTERLTKLDARVADLHVRADRLPPADKETFSSAFDSLSSERQAAFASINAVRDDSKGKLDDLKKAANDKLKIYERSIDSLEDRIDKGVGRI